MKLWSTVDARLRINGVIFLWAWSQTTSLFSSFSFVFSCRARNTAAVCPGLQAQILSCYRDNKDQTLKCSDLAKEYMKCINAAKKVRACNKSGKDTIASTRDDCGKFGPEESGLNGGFWSSMWCKSNKFFFSFIFIIFWKLFIKKGGKSVWQACCQLRFSHREIMFLKTAHWISDVKIWNSPALLSVF